MISLARHPESAHHAARSVRARVARRDGLLEITYLIEGDMGALRLPPPRPPRIADELWRHTCCELFLAADASDAYREFNFSPSGEWAAYAFSGYRRGEPVAAADPRIAVRAGPGSFELEARVPIEASEKRAGLSAVIEDREGRLAYWALRHPPGRPDFHQRQAFALELG
jgi:hypothetical protein